VQVAASREAAHVDLGEVRARQEDQEHEVLRTHNGERVYDAHDIYVLCRLDEISVMLDSYSLERRAMTMAVPRNANERHMLEFGHMLTFGCCYERVVAETRPQQAQEE